MWTYHARAVFRLLVGAVVGLKFADIDQVLPFLTHRSILTHSCLLALLLLWWARRQSEPQRTPARLLAVGFSLANAVHLSFDLFPRAWQLHALIHLPGYGWTSPLFSQVWLFSSLFVCLWLALQGMRYKQELLLGLACLAGSVAVAALAEETIAARALTVLILAGMGAFALPRRSA